eukprot:364570-Chlamydomonas_euryale.AAC.16
MINSKPSARCASTDSCSSRSSSGGSSGDALQGRSAGMGGVLRLGVMASASCDPGSLVSGPLSTLSIRCTSVLDPTDCCGSGSRRWCSRAQSSRAGREAPSRDTDAVDD